MTREIVVAVDGSEGAEHAARFAGELARQLHATIVLVYAFDAPAAATLGMAAMTQRDVEHVKDEVAKGSFESATAVIGDNVTIEREVSFGHPAHEVVAVAKQRDAYMVVCGSRGHSAVQGLLLGSVSDRIVRTAPCPVVVVR